MPARAAASEFDPTAYVWRPKRVIAKTIPKKIATAAATTTSQGIWPNIWPVPTSSTSFVGTLRTSIPPVMMRASPRDMPRVPSVTTKGGTRASVISSPLIKPQASPPASATTSPRMITPQPLPPTASIALAETTPANTSTDPTDRSIPAVMITNVAPTDRISSTDASVAMLRMFVLDAKSAVCMIEKTTMIPIRIVRIQTVELATRRRQPVGSSSS